MTSLCKTFPPEDYTLQKVTRAGGTLGFLLGEGIQRGAPPSGAKILAKQSPKFFSNFELGTGGRDILVGGIALLGLTHAYNLYTKNTPW